MQDPVSWRLPGGLIFRDLGPTLTYLPPKLMKAAFNKVIARIPAARPTYPITMPVVAVALPSSRSGSLPIAVRPVWPLTTATVASVKVSSGGHRRLTDARTNNPVATLTSAAELVFL